MSDDEEEVPTVWLTRLEDQPIECWANSILMRLAGAMGLVDPMDPEQGLLVVDPDELLEEAELRIRNWEF